MVLQGSWLIFKRHKGRWIYKLRYTSEGVIGKGDYKANIIADLRRKRV